MPERTTGPGTFREPENLLGFWSAVAAAVSAIVFSVGAVLELLDAIPEGLALLLVYGSSFVLAVAFVAMLGSVHHATPESRRLWSFTGVSFAILYASNVTVAYVVQLFVFVPKARQGELAESEAVLLSDTFGSFLQAVDGLGYLFMGLATLAAAPAFVDRGLERWIRRFFVANGFVTVPVFLTYFVDPGFLPLAGLWSVTVPASTLLVAADFRRRSRTRAE